MAHNLYKITKEEKYGRIVEICNLRILVLSLTDSPTQRGRICFYIKRYSGYTFLYLLSGLLEQVPRKVDSVCVGHIGQEEDS